ncbi:MAG TPA: FGGY family carbohydrate kinase [Bacillales bacterium]|nr:FGGY family carbohydrate kinase [Bacillales bacterium]
MSRVLSIDIGTTHCKAGLFAVDGSAVKTAVRQTNYDPVEMWKQIVSMIVELTRDGGEDIAAVGISSMAETGLLLDRKTGQARTGFLPWFDDRATEECDDIERRIDPYEQFMKSGLRPSRKYGLAKLLWIARHQSRLWLDECVWLSAADYAAYRLTGAFATDYTLASRTYAFRIDTKQWDRELLKVFDLNPALFPDVHPSGRRIADGAETLDELPFLRGVPVAVCGHDHVCAALAAGAVEPGIVFDSVGTAETLVGTMKEKKLDEKAFHSGLSFGLHVIGDAYFWMGGLPASGGSIEWLRREIASGETLTYERILQKLSKTDAAPTGILYFPYLSGSGAPRPDQHVKAAFVGFANHHTGNELLKAIFEGTCYEMEAIRRCAAALTDSPIETLVAVGGGTNNPHWMQMKADVSHCTFLIPEMGEATLFGAAIAAGMGCGIYESYEEARSMFTKKMMEFTPDEERHEAYRNVYENGYMRLQDPLRQYFSNWS